MEWLHLAFSCFALAASVTSLIYCRNSALRADRRLRDTLMSMTPTERARWMGTMDPRTRRRMVALGVTG